MVGRLEATPHGSMHVAVNGWMGRFNTAGLDPLFWLHHCNVDRLSAQWQRAGNRIPQLNFTYDGQFVDPAGAAQSVTAAQALDFEAMGFTYDILTEPVVALRGVEKEQSAFQNRSVTQDLNVIGKGANSQPSVINKTTQITVPTKNIADNLFTSRTFRSVEPPSAPRLAAEQSRILAKLGVADLKGAVRQCMVNVFVNAPDLSPDTSADDPHYAGSFSFFGQHYFHHGGTFLVDVSNALRDQAGQGRLAAENVKIQVLPVRLDPNTDVQAQFVVNSVELISV